MTEPTNLTKLTFNATPNAMTALEESADLLGYSRTDTANRALQLYAAVLKSEPGQTLIMQDVDGTALRLVVLDRAVKA